jgi:SAM-dependent methyltransferase
MKDLEKNVIKDFGEEWKFFSHKFPDEKIQKNNFNQYFCNFPFKILNKKSIGFDAGCGTGRWANYILKKGFKLNCIEPSEAIKIAKKNLKKFKKVKFINKTILDCKLQNNSQDFGYCLGVLHHTNNVKKNLIKCNNILKKDAPFLLYLYYNFENKGKLFKFIWKVSDIIRRLISKLPFVPKKFFCFMIAIIIYLPLAKLSFLLEKININNQNIPLNYYKDKNFYIIYNDALDRFGTKLEKRFSKREIKDLLTKTGFKEIKFNKTMPFWTVISYKK